MSNPDNSSVKTNPAKPQPAARQTMPAGPKPLHPSTVKHADKSKGDKK